MKKIRIPKHLRAIEEKSEGKEGKSKFCRWFSQGFGRESCCKFPLPMALLDILPHSEYPRVRGHFVGNSWCNSMECDYANNCDRFEEGNNDN